MRIRIDAEIHSGDIRVDIVDEKSGKAVRRYHVPRSRLEAMFLGTDVTINTLSEDEMRKRFGDVVVEPL